MMPAIYWVRTVTGEPLGWMRWMREAGEAMTQALREGHG